MDLSSQREKEFKAWCHRKKSKDGWIAEDAKANWLSGNKQWNDSSDTKFSSIKELLLEIKVLTSKEKESLSTLPENLFSLERADFLEAKLIIDQIIKTYPKEMQEIINQRYVGNPQRIQYANFKKRDYAKEYLIFLESEKLDMKKTHIGALKSSKNLIFRGAPGTGKTYLARQIAAEMIGCDVEELGDNPQFEFVQFHPNYDYTDFVEGLRPVNVDGSIGFELQNGIFKAFCEKAKKTGESGGQDNFDSAWNAYLEFINNSDEKEQLTEQSYLTVNSRNNLNVNYESKAQGTVLTKSYVYELYKNSSYDKQTYYRGQGRKVLEKLENKFELIPYKKPSSEVADKNKPFIFLIDEINRGDMAKIFGELFFSLDPNYRGTTGAISTQYANMHETDDKFYIPENVYIIGTMNDIDRSVDTFDFAMRRRFRFVEVKAEDRLEMLDEQLGDNAEEAKTRLTNLNNVISDTEGLNSHYHIGPSYFLKLKNIAYDYDVLWSDYLEPLLEDYVHRQLNEAKLMESFKDAYYLSDKVEETADDTAQG